MSGKTNFLVKLITEVWRHKDGKSCFDRIYVFSPSVNHDPMWRPVREMIESEILDLMNPNHRNEPFFFDEPLPEAAAPPAPAGAPCSSCCGLPCGAAMGMSVSG